MHNCLGKKNRILQGKTKVQADTVGSNILGQDLQKFLNLSCIPTYLLQLIYEIKMSMNFPTDVQNFKNCKHLLKYLSAWISQKAFWFSF